MRTRWLLLIGVVSLVFRIYPLYAMTPPQAAKPISGKGMQNRETPLGDLAADAVLRAGKADIAFVPAGLLKEKELAAGPLSDETLSDVCIFPDESLVVLSVSGARLTGALERSLEIYPKNNYGFLQVAGISVDFNPEGSPGKRIQSIKVKGSELDPGKNYKVAMPISLARGSQGYFRFWDKGNIDSKLGITFGEAVVRFAHEKGSLAYSEDYRIEPMQIK